MLYIDGQAYNVGIVSLKRTADFLDSEATTRLENGDMFRDLIGVYFNYELKLEPSANTNEYNRLWEKLTESVEFHTVTVPYANSTFTFVAYFANVSDELLLQNNSINYWKNLSVNFKAKTPARR
ncbi:MAG: hypothetical protein RR198_07265 [Oscillospiraceae bacterium]